MMHPYISGFDPALPTVWVMEGIMTYFPEDSLVILLQRIKALSAPGSAILGDVINSATRYNFVIQKRTALLEQDGAAYRLYIDNPERLWQKCGITENRYYFLGDPLASYEGRYPPCWFLKLMYFVIRLVLGLPCTILALLLGRFAAWYIAVPVAAGTVCISEAWASVYVEPLARHLKMALWPSAYFIEGRL